ncbi:MAG: hypothetical protein J6D42_04065 [Clostridia bacterium]|nr:hypothetical protein [Clostridia bacterium]
MNNFKKTLVLFACAVLLVAGSVFGTFAYLTDNDSVTNTFTVGQVHLTLDEALVSADGMGKALDADGDVVAYYDNNGDLNGDLSSAHRWQPSNNDPDQQYHLLPGHTYVKDPTVTVDANSEDAYVRMMVTITYKDAADAVFAEYLEDSEDMFSAWIDIDSTNWIVNDAGEKSETEDVTVGDSTVTFVSRTYEFRYVGNDNESPKKGIVVKNPKETELPALFTKLTVPGAVTNDQIALLADMKIEVVAHAIQADGFADAGEAWEAFTE